MILMTTIRVSATMMLVFATGVILCNLEGCEVIVEDETCSLDRGYANVCDAQNVCYEPVDESDDFDAICATTCTKWDAFTKFKDCAACQPNETVYGTTCFQVSPGSGFFDCETLSSVNPGGDVFTCTQKDCGAGYNKTRDCTHLAIPPPPG